MTDAVNTDSPEAPIAEPLDLVQLANPEPVSMWPETVAWDILIVGVLLVLAFYIWRRHRAHSLSLWKRQALKLTELNKNKAKADSWFHLIKRIYLVHHSRVELQDLGDEQLLHELPQLNADVCIELVEGHYKNNGYLSEQANDDLYEAVVSWLQSLPVERHKVAQDV